MPSMTYHPCRCLKCIKSPAGYELQTKDLIRKHKKRYGDVESLAAGDLLPSPEEHRPPLGDLDTNRQPPVVTTNASCDRSMVPCPATNQPDSPLVEFEERDGYYDDDGYLILDDWWPDDANDAGEMDVAPAGSVNGGREDEATAVVGREAAPTVPACEVASLDQPIAGPLPPPLPQIQVQRHFHDSNWRRIGEIDVRTPGSDAHEADRPDIVLRAFSEESCIRIAYLQAVIANVYSHVSVLRATDIIIALFQLPSCFIVKDHLHVGIFIAAFNVDFLRSSY
ncbi:hypothetical protein BDZ97DRAFT_1919045 [Flammula alnicola]|nr:hypothetical protein BDZ97DRAFT_1919045 [Flammula alnicola]